MSLKSTGAALSVAFCAFAVSSVMSHRKDEAMQLRSFAGIIGANSIGALRSHDRALAERTLETLREKVEISGAILYDAKGELFARYRAGKGQDNAANAADAGNVADAANAADAGNVVDAADDASRPSLDADAIAAANVQGSAPWSTRMRQFQSVDNASGQVGMLMIEADLSAMWLDILRGIGLLFAAMLASLMVAMVLAARFRRSIAEPVGKLIGAARQVADSQDYSLRIAHTRTDELGALIDSFNTMLAQIDDRGSALTHHRDELERQVGVRTEQLEKAKNAAEAASRAKSAFLATMSHEIRTPMNGVLGMTDMLLGTQLGDVQRNYTQLVKSSGEHLLVIINDILDFSKIEAGKLSVEYINFNLWDLLDDIHTVYTPQAQAKHIGLDFEIANDIPVAICGDPNRLRQIMANLLGNAIKFTDTGRILATVRVASEDAQAVSLRFEVHDTGIGVAREARTRIFEAFSQADDSTTRKYGGTGLGLAISKQLVELMGGAIGVDNALTQGSVFWFTVSFDKRRVEPDAHQDCLKGLRVLLVDEGQDSRKALERQLASWQVACTSAASALDSIERLRTAAAKGEPFDVAIIDMEMARTSGLALAAAIKADDAIRPTRLLLVSPDRLAADPVQRRAAGVAYQLTRPARSADLFACLGTHPRSGPGSAAVGVQAARAAASVDARQPDPRATLRPGRRKVLLAEDNPVNVEVARAMLDSFGLEVHCARHGAEALQALRGTRFDAVLMDCQMPVMDGFAATAAIRRMERETGGARALPIIAITANALQGDREACLAAGMDDYLSKPFTQHELGAVLGRWIGLALAATAHHADAAAACMATPVPRRAPALAPLRRASDVGQRSAINERALDAIRALSRERGAELVHKVVTAYVDDTPQHLLALREAVAALDALVVRKVAHSLKSASANVGADTFARLCKQLEQLGRDDTTEGATVILTDMEQEFRAVRHSLGAILEKEM